MLVVFIRSNFLSGFSYKLVDFIILTHSFHLLYRLSLSLGKLILTLVHLNPENLNTYQDKEPLRHFPHHEPLLVHLIALLVAPVESILTLRNLKVRVLIFSAKPVPNRDRYFLKHRLQLFPIHTNINLDLKF